MAFRSVRFAQRTALWSLVDQVATTGGLLAYSVVAARSLTPDAFGVLSVAFATTLLALAVQQGLVVTPLMSQGSVPAADYLHLRALPLLVTAGTVLGGGYLLSHGSRAAAVTLPVLTATWLSKEYFRRRLFIAGQVRLSVGADVLAAVAPLLAVLFALRRDWEPSVAGLLLALALGMTFALLLQLSQVSGYRPHRNDPAVRRAVAFGSWQVGTALLSWGTLAAPVVIVGVLSGPSLAGGLRAAQTLGNAPNVISASLENWWPHQLAQMAGSRGAVAVRSQTSAAVLVVIGVGIPLLVVVAQMSKSLMVMVFGAAYASYAPVLTAALSVSILILISTIIFGAVRTKADGTRTGFIVNLLSGLAGVGAVTTAAMYGGIGDLALALVVGPLLTAFGYMTLLMRV